MGGRGDAASCPGLPTGGRGLGLDQSEPAAGGGRANEGQGPKAGGVGPALPWGARCRPGLAGPRCAGGCGGRAGAGGGLRAWLLACPSAARSAAGPGPAPPSRCRPLVPRPPGPGPTVPATPGPCGAERRPLAEHQAGRSGGRGGRPGALPGPAAGLTGGWRWRSPGVGRAPAPPCPRSLRLGRSGWEEV